MNKFVIDSSAWIEYFKGSKSGKKLGEYFKNNELFTTSLCVAEVTAKVLKEGFSADVAVQAIRSLSVVNPIDLEIGESGGKVYFELRKTRSKIALSDAISLVVAKKIGAIVLTFDNDFKGLNESVVLTKSV